MNFLLQHLNTNKKILLCLLPRRIRATFMLFIRNIGRCLRSLAVRSYRITCSQTVYLLFRRIHWSSLFLDFMAVCVNSTPKIIETMQWHKYNKSNMLLYFVQTHRLVLEAGVFNPVCFTRNKLAQIFTWFVGCVGIQPSHFQVFSWSSWTESRC